MDLLILIVFGFLAGFVDAMAGGGGLISIPALMLFNLPPAQILGTNKLAGTMSTITSTANFLRSGKVDIQLIKRLLPIVTIAAAGGAILVTYVPAVFLKPVITVLLIAVTIHTLFKKTKTHEHRVDVQSSSWKRILPIVLLITIGFYDGFFGPGTGSFLIYIFLMMGKDFVGAAGNAKAINLITNIASLIVFISYHNVNFHYGLAMGLAMIPGSYLGSRLAIKKGNAVVKPVFIVMTLLIVAKQIWDMIA